MRRKEREITNKNMMLEIIDQAETCWLALNGKNKPYVVPVNFGLEDDTIYIHCAPEGKKIEMIKENPNVCLNFCIDCETMLAGSPDTWTTFYKSVTAIGKAELLYNLKARQKGLNAFLKHYAGKSLEFGDADLERVMIIKVIIHEMTGKTNPRPNE
ncbi:MAG: pyridoxamine 5'-phosphate oxidase family protein [Candidatus Cloacimonetes bacterium]|nr:pyridoxamine 5'-phosphate oxidase family protein [Candidatus Cloacimonadota bacterium]